MAGGISVAWVMVLFLEGFYTDVIIVVRYVGSMKVIRVMVVGVVLTIMPLHYGYMIFLILLMMVTDEKQKWSLWR